MTTSYVKALDYWILVAGCGLAFLAALQPHVPGAYHLDGKLLLIGLLPYFVYSLAVALLRSLLVSLAGLVLLVVHAGLTCGVRITGEYAALLLITGPLVLSVLLVPLVIQAMRQPYGLQDDSD